MLLAICWSESSHLLLWRQKSNCSSHIVIPFMELQNSIKKITVSYSDTFKRLINIPLYTSASLAFTMNATDHINVVFRKFAYGLMSRVTASPNSIVTGIVNRDAYPGTYHWCHVFRKQERKLEICCIVDHVWCKRTINWSRVCPQTSAEDLNPFAWIHSVRWLVGVRLTVERGWR